MAVALAQREQGSAGNDLVDRLAADPRLGPRRRRAGRPAGRSARLRGRRPAPGGRLRRRGRAHRGRPSRGGRLPPGSHPLTPCPPVAQVTRSPNPDRQGATVTVEVELPHLYSGKVRDIYDAGDDRLLLVTSDRISAFDVVMNEPITDKGRVLTAMSAFWFDELADVAPSHLISTDLADLPAGAQRSRAGRAGHVVPPGRDAADRVHRARLHHRLGLEGVPHRRHHARHDAARGPARVLAAARAGVHARRPRRPRATTRTSPSTRPSTWSAPSWPTRARDVSLELYRRGAARALRARHHHRRHQVRAGPGRRRAGRGRRGADARTRRASGRPTRRRRAPTPPSFDKQPVRDYLDGLDWDKQPPPPPLPAEVVLATRDRYVEAYERITGLDSTLARRLDRRPVRAG